MIEEKILKHVHQGGFNWTSSRKSNLQFEQFDGTVIKVMGNFEGHSKQKKKGLEVIPITVVECNKYHGLLRCWHVESGYH